MKRNCWQSTQSSWWWLSWLWCYCPVPVYLWGQHSSLPCLFNPLKVEKRALNFLRILKAAILDFSKVLTSLVKQWLGGLMRYCCENCSHWKSHIILWWHFIIITIIIIFKILCKQPLMEKSHQSLLFSLLCSSLAALNNKQWPQERWTRTKMLMLMTPKIWRKTPQDIKKK